MLIAKAMQQSAFSLVLISCLLSICVVLADHEDPSVDQDRLVTTMLDLAVVADTSGILE